MNAEIDEQITDSIAAREYPAAFAGNRNYVRDLAFGVLWDNVQFALSITKIYRPKGVTVRTDGINDHPLSLDDLRMWLMYAAEHPSRKKWKMKVDVDNLVRVWIPIIRGLATGHDKATVDQCEFDMDTHLMPMLSAPVAQLREFYGKLVAALKADPTIPFFVWASFETWGEVVLKHAADDDLRGLKKELAIEIAELVERDVAPDLPKAIAGALQWRSPAALEKIHTAVKGGGKARLVGRESCLFLQIVDVEGVEKATVML